jgi:hypothetical protein
MKKDHLGCLRVAALASILQLTAYAVSAAESSARSPDITPVLSTHRIFSDVANPDVAQIIAIAQSRTKKRPNISGTEPAERAEYFQILQSRSSEQWLAMQTSSRCADILRAKLILNDLHTETAIVSLRTFSLIKENPDISDDELRRVLTTAKETKDSKLLATLPTFGVAWRSKVEAYFRLSLDAEQFTFQDIELARFSTRVGCGK